MMPLLNATYTTLTFIKLNKANININRCDSLSEIEEKQDLVSISSLVLGLINLIKASLLLKAFFPHYAVAVRGSYSL